MRSRSCVVLIYIFSFSGLRLAVADQGPDNKPATAVSPAASIPPSAASPAPAVPPPVVANPSASAASSTVPQPGHSLHGEVFDEGPRQRASLMAGMPKVDFPVGTKSSEAQAFFSQGVGQLHGFWYFEAERSFRQVSAIDPDCAMAYWGLAMANANNSKRAKEFIAKAALRKDSVTPRERAWIESLVAYYAAADNSDRRRQYVRALEAIVQDNPSDIEAKAFLALQIWENGDWMTERSKQIPISSHQAVDTLLDAVFAVQPMHPAYHYRIHLWDTEKPARALQACALCGQTAPGIAHMWHMPGHIYSDLHRYADAAWQQEAATRTDHAYMIRDGVLPDQIFNYAHNNEWLIRDLDKIGRVRDAIDQAKNMIDLPRHPKFNRPDNGNSSSYLGRERLAETLVQYERWADLVSLAGSSYLPPRDTPEDKVLRARLLGSAQAELGHADEARVQLATLTAMLGEERAARYKSADEAEAKARADRKGEDEIGRKMADALKSHAARIQSLEHGIAELKGRLALMAGDLAAAKTEFDKLKDGDEMRREHLAMIYLKLGDKTQAENFARAAIERAPDEVYPLATQVAVLFGVGKKPAAKAPFEKLRSLAGKADLDQPVFERLKPVAKEFNFPDDWRTPQTPGDVGIRPDLTTLGPLCWQPSSAPAWSLPEPDGHRITLEQYRGKPVLVLFYLGSGCLHCVEQLQKFSPLTSQFTAEGISIVAVSSEPLDSLKQSLATLKKGESIAFPLVSDADRAVFRAYKVYDDFENMPLHGAFLIDAAGLVRWRDIGYEPFMDAKFVLEEAHRLLRR